MALGSDVIHLSSSSLSAPPPAALARLERSEDASHLDRMMETNVSSYIGDINDFGGRDRRWSRMISNWPRGESKSRCF